jgi:hypothetical protein
MVRRPLYRALLGFLAFLPFCWIRGVQDYGSFALVGSLYLGLIYWAIDRILVRPRTAPEIEGNIRERIKALEIERFLYVDESKSREADRAIHELRRFIP